MTSSTLLSQQTAGVNFTVTTATKNDRSSLAALAPFCRWIRRKDESTVEESRLCASKTMCKTITLGAKIDMMRWSLFMLLAINCYTWAFAQQQQQGEEVPQPLDVWLADGRTPFDGLLYVRGSSPPPLNLSGSGNPTTTGGGDGSSSSSSSVSSRAPSSSSSAYKVPNDGWSMAIVARYRNNVEVANVVCSQLGLGRSPVSTIYVSQVRNRPIPAGPVDVNCANESIRNGAPANFTPFEPRLSLSRCTYSPPPTPLRIPKDRWRPPFVQIEDADNGDWWDGQLRPPGTAAPSASSDCWMEMGSYVRCEPPPALWEFKLVNQTEGIPSRGLVMMRPVRQSMVQPSNGDAGVPQPPLPWGTVHRNFFVTSLLARRFLCRALGFPNARNPAVLSTTSPYGTADPIIAPSYLMLQSCPPSATSFRGCTQYTFSAQWGRQLQLSIQCDDEVDPNLSTITAVKFVNGWSPSSGQVYVQTPFTGESWLFIPARVLLDGSPLPPYDANVTKLSHNFNALKALCAVAGFPNAAAPALRFVGRGLAIPLVSAVPFQQMVCSDDAGVWGGGNRYNISQHCRFLRSDVDMSGDNYLPAGLDCFPENFAGNSSSTSISNSSGSSESGGPLQRWEFKLANATKINSTTGASINGVVMMRPNSDAPWGLVSSPRDDNYGLHQAVCGTLGFNLDASVAFATRNLATFRGGSNDYQLLPNERLVIGAPTYLEIVSCPHPIYLSNTSDNRRPRLTSVQDNCTYSPVGSALEGTSKALAVDCDTSNGWGAEGVLNFSKTTFNGPTMGTGYFSLRMNSNVRTGYVCSNDKNALAVLCRRAGFQNATADTVSIRGTAAWANSVYSFVNLRCPPDPAATLNDCSHEAVEAEKCAASLVHCLLPDLPWNGFAFRLVGGPTPASGRLQVRPSPDRAWGSVAAQGWTDINSRHMLVAICSALGFTDPRRPRYRPLSPVEMTATYGEAEPAGGPAVPVWISYTGCQPTQTADYVNFVQCLKGNIGTTLQNHDVDLAIDCEGPPVPLNSDLFEFRATYVGAAGINKWYRIEMRENSTAEWGRIHQRSADVRTIDTACRTVGMLAPPPNDTLPVPYFHMTMYKNYSMPSKIAGFSCGYRAATLRECAYDPSSYLNNDFDTIMGDFVVDCAPPVKSGDPKEYRLANGVVPWEGRLEVRMSPEGPWKAMIEAFQGNYYTNMYFSQFFATRFAICRTVGYPYAYNATRYGYLHAPPRILPHGTFGGANASDTSTHAPMLSLQCTGGGGYGERMSNCAANFMGVPSSGPPPNPYDPALTFSFDCESKLYDLAAAEFRLNYAYSAASSYKTFGLVEIRPSLEAGWGTFNVRDGLPISALVAANLCRTVNGSAGPANFADQRILGNSDLKDPQAGGIPLQNSLDAQQYPIHAYEWSCPSPSSPSANGSIGIRGCSSGILPGDSQAVSRSTFQHQYDLLLDCGGVPPANASRKWEYRLTQNNVDTTAKGIGILEVRPYEGGLWGTLCGDYPHTPFPALQACRGLGFDSLSVPEGFMMGPPQSFTTVAALAPFKTAIGSADQYAAMPVWFSNIQCPPDVSLLSTYSPFFVSLRSTSDTCKAHTLDVALDCNTHLYKISEFEFRAVPVFQGFASIVRLEVRPNATAPWGTVYEPLARGTIPSLDVRISNLIKTLCAFAGFPDPSRVSSVMVNSYGSGPVWLSGANCTDETTGQPVRSGHPSGCRFAKGVMGAYTDHTLDLSADCLFVSISTPLTDLSPIRFRLNETTGHATRNNERGYGRVEAKPTSYAEWGTVGNGGFTNEQAPALCRSMGYLNPDPANAQMVYTQQPLASGRQWLSIPADRCPPMLNYNASARITDCSGGVWTSSFRYTMFLHTSDLWIECYPPPAVTADSCVGVTQTAELEVSATVSATILHRPTFRPIPAPPQAVLTAQKMSDTVGVVSAMSIGSATGGQLGVANAMARLAKCGGGDGNADEKKDTKKKNSGQEKGADGNNDDDNEEDVPILIHPLRFSVWGGQGNPLGMYYAASFSNMLIIPLAAGLIARFIIPRAIIFASGLWGAAARGHVRRRGAAPAATDRRGAPLDTSGASMRSVQSRSDSNNNTENSNNSNSKMKAAAAAVGGGGGGMTMEEALTTVGWPFVVAMPIITLAEGTGVAIVKSLSSGTFVGVAFGLMGLACLAAFVAVWVHALMYVIPRHRLALLSPESSARVGRVAVDDKNKTKVGASRKRANRSVIDTDSEDDGGAEMEPLGHNANEAAPGAAGDAFSLTPPPSPGGKPTRRNSNSIRWTRQHWLAYLLSPALEWMPASEEAKQQRQGKEEEGRSSSTLEQPLLREDEGGAPPFNLSQHADTNGTMEEGSAGVPNYPQNRGPTSPAAPRQQKRRQVPRVTHDIIERYSNALGDKRWYYAELASFGCSLLVGAMEGVPDDYCQPRAVVAAIATILQCALSCLTVIPLEFFLQFLSSICVVPMSLVVVARVFDMSSSSSSGDGGNSSILEVTTAVLITAANFLGIALLALAVVIGIKETLTSREGSRRAYVLRYEHRSEETNTFPSDDAEGMGAVPLSGMLMAAADHEEEPDGLIFEDNEDGADDSVDQLLLGSPSGFPMSATSSPLSLPISSPPVTLQTSDSVTKNPNRSKEAAKEEEGGAGGLIRIPPRKDNTLESRMGEGDGRSALGGAMPPSFEDFKGPRWQAELLYRVEQTVAEQKRRSLIE